jgi:hypothetical protein
VHAVTRPPHDRPLITTAHATLILPTLECCVVAEAVLRLGHADGQLVKAHRREALQDREATQQTVGVGGTTAKQNRSTDCKLQHE